MQKINNPLKNGILFKKKDLLQYIKTKYDHGCPIEDKPVFFCELEEDENDPMFEFIATLIYLSSIDVIEVTKTMWKSGGIDYALMSPPSIEQMKIMIKINMKI